MSPPSAQDAARRLLILLAINSHALRLMMIWDFSFRVREAFKNLTVQTPGWRSLGVRGEWLKLRANWNWFWERRAIRSVLTTVGLSAHLTPGERELLCLGLSQPSRESANQFVWEIEAAACIAWALRLLPRMWPMDEQFDGKLDAAALGSPERRLVETATLRPIEEIQTACERVRLWHWRARQLSLQRKGYPWPPKEATPETVADLRSKGLDSLDGLVRVTTRISHEQGVLEETRDDDFVAKGAAYRRLSEDDAQELLSIALERHKALNWLCGLAPNNDWTAVPTET